MESVDPGFAAYVAARQRHLLGVAVLLCGDRGLAEDLVQEALVKMARHWPKVRAGAPDAYARKIIYHDSIRVWKRRTREVIVAEVPERAGNDPTDAWQARTDVRNALQQLAPRQRAVIVLRYYEELSEAESASALGVSVGTVKSQTHAALGNLRRHLSPALPVRTGRVERSCEESSRE
jgi:RNA polymerase sigma-70 factor (sigma-E family)